MVDPLSYFSFQPVPHHWCNKGHGVCYPVCGMIHIIIIIIIIIIIVNVIVNVMSYNMILIDGIYSVPFIVL